MVTNVLFTRNYSKSFNLLKFFIVNFISKLWQKLVFFNLKKLIISFRFSFKNLFPHLNFAITYFKSLKLLCFCCKSCLLKKWIFVENFSKSGDTRKKGKKKKKDKNRAKMYESFMKHSYIFAAFMNHSECCKYVWILHEPCWSMTAVYNREIKKEKKKWNEEGEWISEKI